MRNYPLLLKNGNMHTSKNWQNTYVNSLVMNIKSLVDYSNYFLADYRRGPDFISLGSYEDMPCFSVENLKYHQYRDTEKEGYYFLRASDWDDHTIDPMQKNAKRIRAGRHIINNNQKESNLNTYKDWENMVIQPIGYTAFYLMTFKNGQFIFNFTKNAQRYYGKEYTVTPAAFYDRFFYKTGEVDINEEDSIIKVFAEHYSDASNYHWGIQDLQGLVWTDVTNNPVIGFPILKTELNSFGEEIIVDVSIQHTVELDKTSSAVYTMTALEEVAAGQYCFPIGSVLRFL